MDEPDVGEEVEREREEVRSCSWYFNGIIGERGLLGRVCTLAPKWFAWVRLRAERVLAEMIPHQLGAAPGREATQTLNFYSVLYLRSGFTHYATAACLSNHIVYLNVTFTSQHHSLPRIYLSFHDSHGSILRGIHEMSVPVRYVRNGAARHALRDGGLLSIH